MTARSHTRTRRHKKAKEARQRRTTGDTQPTEPPDRGHQYPRVTTPRIDQLLAGLFDTHQQSTTPPSRRHSGDRSDLTSGRNERTSR